MGYLEHLIQSFPILLQCRRDCTLIRSNPLELNRKERMENVKLKAMKQKKRKDNLVERRGQKAGKSGKKVK